MMAFFLIVLGVPLLLAAAAFVFLDGISWKEFAMIFAVELLIAGCGAGAVSCTNAADTEVWDGRVASKKEVPVPCEHSYSCNCHQVCSGSGKNRSCSTECDTCYEHHGFFRTMQGYDYDWDVYTTNGETVTIDRIDRQGTSEPPRWTRVALGEPTSLVHPYDNYVKASPGTLFRHQGLVEKYKGRIPANPQGIYDYYRLDHLVDFGVGLPDARQWNADLAELNADLGKQRQANVIVVLVRDTPDDWYYALEEAWIGGKKNDVVLVVDVDGALKPQWAMVMCWTTNELFRIKLRDDVMNDQVLDRTAIMADLRTNVSQYFVRKPMKDFEYLQATVVPTATEWTVTMLVALVAGIALIIVCQMNDIFGDERPRYRSRSRR